MRSLKKGDIVRVKEGVQCPDDEEIDISGWQGRVAQLSETEEGEPLVTIRWDSKTLEQLPEEYILDSEEKNLSWSALTLYRSEVKPAEARDTETDVEEERDQLHTTYSWYGMGEEGKRVFEVLKDVDQQDEMKCLSAWEKYLQQRIDFPVEAEICNTFGVHGFSTGDRVQINEINFKDDRFGLIVGITYNDEQTECPLINLRMTDEEQAGYMAIQDYSFWHGNH